MTEKQFTKKGSLRKMNSFTFDCPQSNNPQNHTVHLAAFNKSFRLHILKKYSKSYHPESHSTGECCVLVYVTSTVVHFLGLSEMLCGISKGVRETALPLGTILITSPVYLKTVRNEGEVEG